MEYTDNYDFCRPYLTQDERILWKGKPEKGQILHKQDIIMIPFSIFWLGFSVFWEIGALKSGGSLFFALWGLPFIAVGLYLLIGRHIQSLYLRNKTFYVVTNKRLIIKKGSKLEIRMAQDLPPMEVQLHKNGNGTITFWEEVYVGRGRRRNTFLMLENLPDVAKAQNAISSMER
ncbi:MAG: hypothetical protein IJ491_07285 [Clostridia bacterium]|nr:hypothetical protein [Clostridia bacterium]